MNELFEGNKYYAAIQIFMRAAKRCGPFVEQMTDFFKHF